MSEFWSMASGFFALLSAAAVISVGLILLLRPVLVRYALAHPNARSSHRQPTPQGGGIAVMSATVIVLAGVTVVMPLSLADLFRLAVILVTALGLAGIGMADDIRPLGVLPRLFLQSVAVTMTLMALPPHLQIFPALPLWMERGLMFVALLWFVNLVNFMDGIDWMTVAEAVPLTGALALFGIAGALPHEATLVALALCGAMIGFAPFNRPVARLFLGDVGSLPIGLLLGWLLILFGTRHFTAALLLPLYYVADATITLLRRFINGEPFLKAHRSHFYQRATDNGFSVPQIVARVFLLNLALIALAAVTLMSTSTFIHVACLLTGGVLTTLLLLEFSRKKHERHSG